MSRRRCPPGQVRDADGRCRPRYRIGSHGFLRRPPERKVKEEPKPEPPPMTNGGDGGGETPPAPAPKTASVDDVQILHYNSADLWRGAFGLGARDAIKEAACSCST